VGLYFRVGYLFCAFDFKFSFNLFFFFLGSVLRLAWETECVNFVISLLEKVLQSFTKTTKLKSDLDFSQKRRLPYNCNFSWQITSNILTGLSYFKRIVIHGQSMRTSSLALWI